MVSSAFSALFLIQLVGFSNAFQISSGRLSSAALQMSTKKSGAGFNYDPSNYKDSNSVGFVLSSIGIGNFDIVIFRPIIVALRIN